MRIGRQDAINAPIKMVSEGLEWVPVYHLKELPSAEPELQWIPCSERLPKRDGEYLVTYEKGYAEDYGFDLVGIAPFEVDCEGFGIWQEKFDLHTLGSLGSDWVDIPVIAWRPLPEPYREEDE